MACCHAPSNGTWVKNTVNKDEDLKSVKSQRRTPYIRWFGITHPELPPAGTAPSTSNPMVNPIPVALGISADKKAKHIRNPRLHLINAAHKDPLNPSREAILISITAYTKEPTPSYELGRITFWFSLSVPYRKDLLLQLVQQGILKCTGWSMADPPALEVRLLLNGDQCSRPCCGCGCWEQLDEPDKKTGKRKYRRLFRCSGCLQCFFCSKDCQTRHWGDHSRYCISIRQAYGERLVY